MNQPEELAEKIQHELETHSFKSLIARFRNIQQNRNSTQLENNELIRTASQLSADLKTGISRCQHELSIEKLITSELHKRINDRRQHNQETLNVLELRESQIGDQLAQLRESRLAKAKELDFKIDKIVQLKDKGGLTEDQHSQKLALALIAHLPVFPSDDDGNNQSKSSIEEQWQKIGFLVESAEQPYNPLIKNFPELNDFLV